VLTDVSKCVGLGAGRGVDVTYGKHKERANVIVLLSIRVRARGAVWRDLLLLLGVGKEAEEGYGVAIEHSRLNQLNIVGETLDINNRSVL
jgi:hypothetical protein